MREVCCKLAIFHITTRVYDTTGGTADGPLMLSDCNDTISGQTWECEGSKLKYNAARYLVFTSLALGREPVTRGVAATPDEDGDFSSLFILLYFSYCFTIVVS